MTRRGINIWGAAIPLIVTLFAVMLWLFYDFFLSADNQFKAEEYEDLKEVKWKFFFILYFIALILTGVFTSNKIAKVDRSWVYHAIIASVSMTAIPILFILAFEIMQDHPFQYYHPIELVPIIFVLLICHLVIWMISVYLFKRKIEIRKEEIHHR